MARTRELIGLALAIAAAAAMIVGVFASAWRAQRYGFGADVRVTTAEFSWCEGDRCDARSFAELAAEDVEPRQREHAEARAAASRGLRVLTPIAALVVVGAALAAMSRRARRLAGALALLGIGLAIAVAVLALRLFPLTVAGELRVPAAGFAVTTLGALAATAAAAAGAKLTRELAFLGVLLAVASLVLGAFGTWSRASAVTGDPTSAALLSSGRLVLVGSLVVAALAIASAVGSGQAFAIGAVAAAAALGIASVGRLHDLTGAGTRGDPSIGAGAIASMIGVALVIAAACASRPAAARDG